MFFLGVFLAAPAFAVDADTEAFLQKLWRRYKTAPALAIVINEKETNGSGATIAVSRKTVVCSERGHTRILSPNLTWAHVSGQTFGDCRDFPGTYVAVSTGAAGSASLKAMESMFFSDTIPFDARLRLAASWEEAFEYVIKAVGEDGTMTIEEGEWGDGAAATLLRAKAADGSYEGVFFIDKATGLLRGRVEQFGIGASARVEASVSEPEIRARLGQELHFATAGRTRFPTFEAIQEDFNKRYQMPTTAIFNATSSP